MLLASLLRQCKERKTLSGATGVLAPVEAPGHGLVVEMGHVWVLGGSGLERMINLCM